MSTAFALAAACTARALDVAYQPIVDLRTGRVGEVEALVRWPDAPADLSPAAAVQLAEAHGFLHDLFASVLDKALDTLAQLPSHLPPLRVSTNVSATQLDDTEIDLASTVHSALVRTGLPGTRLMIEVTESHPLDPTGAARTTAHRLRELGVGVALDDYGVAHSCRCRQALGPIDRIKIDRSVIDTLATSAPSRAIASEALALAEDNGADVVAEGVDCANAADALPGIGALGIELAQGYLFSRPVAANALAPLLTQDFSDRLRIPYVFGVDALADGRAC